jgi:hypothetical protein
LNIRLEHLKNFLVIHFPVQMHKQISEFGHAFQSLDKIIRQHFQLSENLEAVCMIMGSPSPSSSDNVVAYIDCSFYGYDQIVFGTVYFIDIRKKFLF